MEKFDVHSSDAKAMALLADMREENRKKGVLISPVNKIEKIKNGKVIKTY